MDFRVFKGFFLKNIDYHLIEKPEIERKLFNKSTAIFHRRITQWDTGLESDDYFIICDKEKNLDSYKSDHRNRIKRFKKKFIIRKVSREIFLRDSETLYNNKPHRIFKIKIPLRRLIDRPGKHEYIVVYDLIKNKTEGFCDLIIGERSIEFSVIRFGNSNLTDWGLIHYLNNEYLNENTYLVNGFKSYFHGNNFQQKLLNYFGYRKCYVELEHNTKISKPILFVFHKILPSNRLKAIIESFL